MITSFPATAFSNKIGGTLKFFFIDVNDVDVEPEIYDGKLIGDYTFIDGKELLTGLFDYETGKLDIADNSGSKGNLTKNSFSALVSGSSAAYDKLFCEMRTKRFIVFISDTQKNVRVLGRKNAGAIFDFAFSTKSKYADAPGYEFKFTCESSCCPPISTQTLDIC